MKLTLRTLLAFLHGTMEEDDAAALRKKIRESDAIRELIQRIRHVVSQPQLPAPKSSKGSIGDPNSSSEYIDNTLDLERVAEFEKMTIGADMLLSEVAESHQILASLAEIDKGVSARLRNRLSKSTEEIYKSEMEEPEMFPVVEDHSSIQEEYVDVDIVEKKNRTDFELAPPRIQTEADEPSGEFGSIPPIQTSPLDSNAIGNKSIEIGVESEGALVESNFSDDSEDVDKDKVQPVTTNSSTSKSKSSQSRVAARSEKTGGDKNSGDASQTSSANAKLLPVILATACITALVVLLAASFMYRPGDNVAENQDEEKANVEEAGGNENEGNGQKNADDSTDDDKDATTNQQNQPNADSSEAENDGTPAGTELVNRDLKSRTEPVGNAVGTPNKDGMDEGKGTEDGKAATATKEEKKEEVLNLFKNKDYGDKKKSGKAADMEKSGKGAVKDAGEPEKDAKPSRLTDTKKMMAEAAGLANGESVGALKSALQPTLRKTNLPDATWINLAQEEPVFINDSIVALQDCVSNLEILESVRLQLYGFCRIELKKNEGQILPRVDVQNGLVAFDNLKDPNNTIDVSASGKQLQVTFVDKNSRFAVVNYQLLSASGEKDIIQVAALTGRVFCKYDGDVLTLEPGKLLKFESDKFEIVPFKTVPSIMTQRLSTLTTAAKESFFALGLENPGFSTTVKKALSDTRPYVRKFAAISGLALGENNNLLRFLSEEQNRGFWRDAYLFARERALTDKSFRTAFNAYCSALENPSPDKPNANKGLLKTPEEGKKLFEFLTVTTDQALENGMDTQLVDGLQSSDLWMRAISIQTLYAITGKTKFFRAEDREEKRRKWVKAWEKSHQAGEIRISTPFQPQQFE